MFNEQDIKKITSMSDDLLKDKISVAINSVTGNDISLSEKDIKKIRQVVLGMSADDINNVMSQMNPSEVENLRKILTDSE